MRSSSPPMLPIFRSRHLCDLLALLCLHPQREFTMSELAQTIGLPLTTVQREVERLKGAQLISGRRVGRAHLVKVQTSGRLYTHLRPLLDLTFAPQWVVVEEFGELTGLERLILHGEWAQRYSGVNGPLPDRLDVLAIGEFAHDDVGAATQRANDRLPLNVETQVRTPSQWRQPEAGSLVATVMRNPHLDVTPEEKPLPYKEKTTMDTSLLYPTLAKHAQYLLALNKNDHGVFSPLGVWLLLATVTRADVETSTAERAALEKALGMPLEDAVAMADSLISNPHPVVANAFAAWAKDGLLAGENNKLKQFFNTLPGDVARGVMPSQREADQWTRKQTYGLIDQYPFDVEDPMMMLTLANALACKVTWQTPYKTTDASALGPGTFSSQVSHVLTTQSAAGHDGWIADSAVGRVAVHVAEANGLRVFSVIAADDVPASSVMEVAHTIATSPRHDVSLFDLPLLENPRWSITESQGQILRGDKPERCKQITLPAWSATSRVDLMKQPALGLEAAGMRIARMLPGDIAIDAVQVAQASYHRTGFEAAAVTAMAWMATGIPHYEDATIRSVSLRFPHPYAVVAVAAPATKTDRHAQDSRAHATPWDGLPVFSAWVTTPEESDTQEK